MNAKKNLVWLVLACVCSPLAAQVVGTGTLFKLPRDPANLSAPDRYYGIAYGPVKADGTRDTILMTDVTIIVLPDPTPPAPTLKGPVWVIVIKPTEKQGLTVNQTLALTELQDWTDTQAKDKLRHLEFTSDAVSSEGVKDANVASWVSLIPANESPPYAFIFRQKTTKGNHVFWQGSIKSDQDVAAIVAKVKEVQK